MSTSIEQQIGQLIIAGFRGMEVDPQSNIAKYIQESMLFDSLMTSETDIDIYNYEEKVLTVVIKNGTLTLQPHAEEGAF